MTCKQCEKMIPSFLNDTLSMEQLDEFMNHVDQCQECKEELTIQFLVVEGMDRLEEGNTFNLNKALNEKLSDIRLQISKHFKLLKSVIVLECVTLLGFAICLFQLIHLF